MCEQIARFGDNGRVAIECGVSFAGCCHGSVVFGRDVRHRQPLRFAIDAIKRLIPGVRQLKETIDPFLDRGRGRNNEREQKYE